MKKIKAILLIVSLVFSSCLLAGCAKNNEEKEVDQNKENMTVANVLVEQFKKEIKNEKDIKEVADKIAQNEILEIETDVASLGKKDYISGFQTEIKDFKKAVTIRPMISTIPFLAYIFEVEDAEKFEETLKSNADLRWNICTEADEMKTAVVDNYVFFIMAPKTFEEE